VIVTACHDQKRYGHAKTRRETPHLFGKKLEECLLFDGGEGKRALGSFKAETRSLPPGHDESGYLLALQQ